MESKIKHLEFTQKVIERMAKNSFLLKGWSITVTAGILALFLEHKGTVSPVTPVIVAFFFWSLDAYYLAHEQRFRRLYDEVRMKHEKDINFTMSTEHLRFYRDEISSFTSVPLLIFYGGQILVSIILLTT